MAIPLAGRAARVDNREAFLAESASSRVPDTGSPNVGRVDGLAAIALNACLSRCQCAAHHRYLCLVLYLRPRRVDELTALLGVLSEDLLVADALASGQVDIASSSANPRPR
jgi:hypothetical protein